MLNFKVLKNKDELQQHIDSCFVDLSYEPTEYPCIGFIYMCPDESYDMQFLYGSDILRMKNDMGV